MRAALKWGILTGVGAYIVAQLVLTFGATLIFGAGPGDPNHPGILLSGCLGIFFVLFAFSAAGYFTGRDTLIAGMGTVSGIVAFAVYAILSRIYTPQTVPVAAGSTPKSAAPTISPVAQAGVSLAALLVVVGIAALMGWLGGRPGVTNARKRQGAATKSSAESTKSATPSA